MLRGDLLGDALHFALGWSDEALDGADKVGVVSATEMTVLSVILILGPPVMEKKSASGRTQLRVKIIKLTFVVIAFMMKLEKSMA